jgi:hypothetical protein
VTVLPLTQLWINRLDTGEAITAYTDRGRPQQFENDLDVRTYANGRRRAITRPGERGELGFEIVRVDLATVTKMREWKSITVQVRDHRGQKWFGVFKTVTPREFFEAALYAVAFTLETVTVDESA